MSKTNWKKMAFGMTTALIASLLIACGNDDAGTDSDADTGTDAGTEETDGGESAAGEGSVYYLNFKPEIADQIEDLAEQYTEETGVEVIMTTAAGGTYEETLRAEITKSTPPTIFFINGPIGYSNWQIGRAHV